MFGSRRFDCLKKLFQNLNTNKNKLITGHKICCNCLHLILTYIDLEKKESSQSGTDTPDTSTPIDSSSAENN